MVFSIWDGKLYISLSKYYLGRTETEEWDSCELFKFKNAVQTMNRSPVSQGLALDQTLLNPVFHSWMASPAYSRSLHCQLARKHKPRIHSF